MGTLSVSLGAIISLVYLLLWFYQPVTSYFSQDDFFHLRIIMDKNITDIPGFFTSHLEGQTFFRPLSRETYNLLMYHLFGLNPLPFHLVNLFLILINLKLIFSLVKGLSNVATAYFSSLIYLVSSVHSVEIYYLASVQTLMMSTLALLSLLFIMKFLKLRFLDYYISSILFFAIALFCHESAVALVGIFFLLIFLSKLNLRQKFLFSFPYFFLGVLFTLSAWDTSGLPKQQVYQPIFHFKTVVNTLGWYVLWSFGLPEMLVDFVKPNLVLKREFILWYGDFAKITFPLLLFVISMLPMAIVLSRKILFNRIFLFFTISFLISISPFLFFPQHKFVYYLSLPIVLFSAALGLILALFWKTGNFQKGMVICLLAAFMIISYQTTALNDKTHWAAKRAKAAQSLLMDIKKAYPLVGANDVFYFVNDSNYPFIAKEWGGSSKQAFYILSGKDAIQLLYNNKNLKAYFEDMEKPPTNIDPKILKVITAKFPY